MNSTLDEQAIATGELNSHLKHQSQKVAPGYPTFLPDNIEKIERVGVTRNASRTPYTVYWIKGRRCCTFFKRKYLFWLLQFYISIKHKQEVQVKSVEASKDFIQVYISEEILCLQQSKFCAFLEYYHLAATTRVVATVRARETKMKQKQLDEKELQEILELAKQAEQKAKEMCESITVHTEKWRIKAEARDTASTHKPA